MDHHGFEHARGHGERKRETTEPVSFDGTPLPGYGVSKRCLSCYPEKDTPYMVMESSNTSILRTSVASMDHVVVDREDHQGRVCNHTADQRAVERSEATALGRQRRSHAFDELLLRGARERDALTVVFARATYRPPYYYWVVRAATGLRQVLLMFSPTAAAGGETPMTLPGGVGETRLWNTCMYVYTAAKMLKKCSIAAAAK